MSLVVEGPIKETDKDTSCTGQQSVFNAVAAAFAHLIATQSRHVNQFPMTIFPGINTAAPTPWNSLSQDNMCLNQNQPDSTDCVVGTNATSSTGWSSVKDPPQWISNDLQVKLQTPSLKQSDDTVLDLSSRKDNFSNTQLSFHHSNYEQCWSNIPKPEEGREFISESETPCQESNKLIRLSRHLATVMTKSSMEACLPYTLTEMFQVYQTILAEQHLTANLHKCDKTRQDNLEYLTTNQAEVCAALPNHFGDIKNETPPVVVSASNIGWQLPPVGTFRSSAMATDPAYPNALLDSVDGYAAIGGTNDPCFLNRYSPPLNFSAFAMDQNMVCPMCRKCFRFEKNLLRHLQKTHATGTGESVLKCKLCNYTTRHYSNMYVHIRTHTGDKPYTCSACGVSFTQGSSLKLHIKSRHHDNGNYFSLTRKPGKNNLTKLWTRVLKKDLPKYNSLLSHSMSSYSCGITNGSISNKHIPYWSGVHPANIGTFGHFMKPSVTAYGSRQTDELKGTFGPMDGIMKREPITESQQEPYNFNRQNIQDNSMSWSSVTQRAKLYHDTRHRVKFPDLSHDYVPLFDRSGHTQNRCSNSQLFTLTPESQTIPFQNVSWKPTEIRTCRTKRRYRNRYIGPKSSTNKVPSESEQLMDQSSIVTCSHLQTSANSDELPLKSCSYTEQTQHSSGEHSVASSLVTEIKLDDCTPKPALTSCKSEARIMVTNLATTSDTDTSKTKLITKCLPFSIAALQPQTNSLEEIESWR